MSGAAYSVQFNFGSCREYKRQSAAFGVLQGCEIACKMADGGNNHKIYGFSAPALDAVSGKAVKFAVGSLVPVVGTFLSDTLETVLSGTRLVKNAVGTAGMIVMCTICVIPILKIGVIQLMLKLTSAIAEPLTDKRISSMMWEVSESVTTVFAVVVMVAVLFLINIALMMAVTSGG